MLAEGRNVIELPKLAAGTYSYSCSMGMYSGRIVVIDPPPQRRAEPGSS